MAHNQIQPPIHTPTDECLSDKLHNMMLAHLDGVYRFSARDNCDELVTQLIHLVLRTPQATSAGVVDDLNIEIAVAKALTPYIKSYDLKDAVDEIWLVINSIRRQPVAMGVDLDKAAIAIEKLSQRHNSPLSLTSQSIAKACASAWGLTTKEKE